MTHPTARLAAYDAAMALRVLPPIERMELAVIEAVPSWHPEHATFEPFPVHAWLVRHPDGPILVDAGVGVGNALIDEWYRPRTTLLADALGALGVGIDEITALVISHLHFDHCGQQAVLDAPVHVQAAEHDAATAQHYTVPEWATIAAHRLRLVHGDEEIAEGIHLYETPGHTPGHQSVLIEAGDERAVIAAQCAFRADEIRTGEPGPTNLHDPTWEQPARESIRRIRSLAPCACHLSHDPAVARLSPS